MIKSWGGWSRAALSQVENDMVNNVLVKSMLIDVSVDRWTLPLEGARKDQYGTEDRMQSGLRGASLSMLLSRPSTASVFSTLVGRQYKQPASLCQVRIGQDRKRRPEETT